MITAIFIGMGLGVERLGYERPLIPTLSHHLWDSRSTVFTPVLEHNSKQAS